MDKITFSQKYPCLRYLHLVAILVVIFCIVFDLKNFYAVRNNFDEAYAHIFSDTKNAVTKSVDERYKVSFLPYPSTPIVNDTSTKLNFSIMENDTDAPNLFTSLVVMNKNTGEIDCKKFYG